MLKEEFYNVIPAQAGYAVIWPGDKETQCSTQLSFSPIVAWAIGYFVRENREKVFYATPICTETLPDSYLILNPNGTVDWPEVQSFTNLDDYVNYLKETC